MAFPAASANLLYQAQRETGKEIVPPCHEASGTSTKRDDEEARDDVGYPPAGRYIVQAVYGYVFLNPTVSHCEALDALLPKGMGSVTTEVVAPVMVS